MNELRFLGPDGERLKEHQTLADAGLEDGDAIDCYTEQARRAFCPQHN